jgi:hypothetical protein
MSFIDEDVLRIMYIRSCLVCDVLVNYCAWRVGDRILAQTVHDASIFAGKLRIPRATALVDNLDHEGIISQSMVHHPQAATPDMLAFMQELRKVSSIFGLLLTLIHGCPWVLFIVRHMGYGDVLPLLAARSADR